MMERLSVDYGKKSKISFTVEPKGGGQRRDDLSDQSVQVRVRGALDVQVAAADVVQRLVVDLVGHIGVLEQRVHAQHGVVRLDHGGGDLRAAPHGERDLGLLAVVDGQTLHHQAPETGAGTTADGVVDQEALEARAVVRELADAVQAQVDDLLTDGVVTAGEVVGGVFFTGDQLFRVEELTVGAGADLVDHGGLQVHEHATGHVLARAGLGEEGVEGVIATTDGLVRGHLAIRLDAVLQAKQLPASISDLDTGLTDVNADCLTHGWRWWFFELKDN